jgi:hypothetical protein
MLVLLLILCCYSPSQMLIVDRPFGQRAERWVKTEVAGERDGGDPVTAKILREDPEWGICFVKLLVFSDMKM